MIRLIATDMDGTFLRKDHTYNEARFARVMAQLDQKGILWVIASGNQYFRLENFFPAFPEMIYIAENGAYIRSQERIYAESAFSRSEVNQLLAYLAKIPGLIVSLSAQKGAYTLSSAPADFVQLMRTYYPQLTIVPSYSNLDDVIFKFSISCPPEQTEALLAQFRRELAGRAHATSSGTGDIDLIRPGVNKASALRTLGEELDIPLASMCAFGDGLNDMEMLAEVGLGVAMANGDAAIREMADAVTTDNESDGVLAFVEEHLLD